MSYTSSAAATHRRWRWQLAHTPPSIQQRSRVQTSEAHLPAAPAQRLLLGINDHGGGARKTLSGVTGHLPHQVTSHFLFKVVLSIGWMLFYAVFLPGFMRLNIGWIEVFWYWAERAHLCHSRLPHWQFIYT